MSTYDLGPETQHRASPGSGEELFQFFRDHEFDKVYPEPIRSLSKCQWTPVEVGCKAAQFLVRHPGAKVLDIGCGPGKFCAIGAATTDGHFTGIEQRERLVQSARKMLRRYRIPRVEIVHANITEVSFAPFDAFYLFNPFQENNHPSLSIDSDVKLDSKLYDLYTDYVYRQLSAAPLGTRVATYWGDQEEIPDSYECAESHFAERLRFWVKRRQHALLGETGAAVPMAKSGGPLCRVMGLSPA